MPFIEKNDSQLILEKNNGKQIVLVSGMKRPYKVQASHFYLNICKKSIIADVISGMYLQMESFISY